MKNFSGPDGRRPRLYMQQLFPMFFTSMKLYGTVAKRETKAHMKSELEFAQKYEEDSKMNWKKVLWS